MAAGESYINPVNPQGYHRNSLFGTFCPNKAKLLAPHKRTFTEEPTRATLISKNCSQKRQPSESLPSVQVTQSTYAQHKRSSDAHDQQWWDMPRKEYKVEQTKFEKFEKVNSDLKIAVIKNHGKCLTRNHKEAQGSHTVLMDSPMLIQSNPYHNTSMLPGGTSKFSHYGDHDHTQRNDHPRTTHSNPKTDWTYSRSRSGLRRKHPKVPSANQVVAFDFDKKYTSNYHLMEKSVEVFSAHSKADNKLQPMNELQRKMLYPQSVLTLEEANGNRISLPKITIEGETLQGYSTRKYESEISRHLRLLELTCEWIKILQASTNFSSTMRYPENVSKLTVVNMNASVSLPGHLNKERHQSQSSNYTLPYCIKMPKLSSYSLPDEHFNALPPFYSVSMKDWRPSFRNKPHEDFVKTKPSNRYRYPDLVIFGHQLKHLLRLGVAMPEESRRRLQTMAESAANGDNVSSVDIEEVQSIVRGIQSALDTQGPSENRDGIDFSSLHPKFKSGSENGRASNASTELDCSEQPLVDLGHLNGFYTQPPQGPSENSDGINCSFLHPKFNSSSENGRAPNASTEPDCSKQPLVDLGHLNGFYTQPPQGPLENSDGINCSFLHPKFNSSSENGRAPNASTEPDCSKQPLVDLGHLNGFYTQPPQGPSENRGGINCPFLHPKFNSSSESGRPSENRDGTNFSFLHSGSENDRAPNASSELDCSEQPLVDSGHLNGFYNNSDSSSGDGSGSGSKHTDIPNTDIPDVQVNDFNATGDGQTSRNQKQAQVSKSRNSVILAKKELKKSMMKPESKQRKSLLPPTTKTHKVADGRPARKIQNKIERMKDKQLSILSEEMDENEISDDLSRSNRSISMQHVSISAIQSRSTQSATANLYNSASRVHSSMETGEARSRELLSGVSSPQRPQVVLDYLSELDDIRLLAEDFLKSVNPPEMIVSRPSTGEATEQRSRLQSRERASRGGSRYIFIDEADKTPDPPPTQEELAIERERLDREREERAMRLKDELEQSLDTSDAIRMRRKQLAEAHGRAQAAEAERQQVLDEERAFEVKKLERERGRHAALLEKLKREADEKYDHQLCNEGMLEDHYRTIQVWDEVGFAYMSCYLGYEFSEHIRKKEEEEIRLKTEKMEMLVKKALDFQRRELMQKLAIAQKKFMTGLENEIEDLDHLLCISRAFIYSYFSRVPEQTYSVPEELLN